MSLLQDLGAQLRATSAELPTGATALAMERLRSASELLRWVRQSSVDPIGVPQLTNAIEHAEHAAAALRVAQDAIAAYLTAIGLTGDGERPPHVGRPPNANQQPRTERPPNANLPNAERPAGRRPERPSPAGNPHLSEPPPQRLGPWWQARIAEITGETAPARTGDTTTGSGGDSVELLRRIAAGVRSGDRARVGADLHAVNAAVGLNLSAIAPAALRRLAGDLLGHEPRPDDLPRLRGAAAGRVRTLLPGAAPALVDTLLARVCRAPAPAGAAVHPADSAVTSAVLVGVLLTRLGRDPSSLDASAPEPIPAPEQVPASDA